MGLKLGRAGANDFVVGDGVLIVGKCEDRGQLVGVIDNQLAAELAVQCTQSRSHQSRQIALDNPLLQRPRAGCRLDNVQQAGPRKVAHFPLMVDIVHQDIKEGEIGSLGAADERITAISVFLISVGSGPLRLEPGREDGRVEADLGGDVEGEFDDTGLGIEAQAHAVYAGDAHQQVRQAGGEGGVLDKGLLLALDEGCEEQDGLLNDPLVVGCRGDLADWDVDLLDRGVLDARVRQRTAALIAEDVGQLLQADLEVFGGVAVPGQIARGPPCRLWW